MKKEKSLYETDLNKKIQYLSLLSSIFEELDSKERAVKKTYQLVGKSEVQKVNWRTGEPMWKDEEKTIPIYDDIYDYVEKEELDTDDKDTLEAIEKVREVLYKTI